MIILLLTSAASTCSKANIMTKGGDMISGDSVIIFSLVLTAGLLIYIIDITKNQPNYQPNYSYSYFWDTRVSFLQHLWGSYGASTSSPPG